MNKEEIEKLKNKLADFENQDIYIEINNAIQYYTTIHNAKIIISNQKLIISNGDNKDFIIELQYLDNVDVKNCTVDMYMDYDMEIILDY